MSDQQSVLAGADAVWDELRTENERLREQIYVGHEFVEDEDTGPKKLDGCRYTWPDGQSCGLSREKHALAVSRELAAARKRIAELEAVYQKCAAGHQYLADSHEYPCPWCEQGKNEQRIAELEADGWVKCSERSPIEDGDYLVQRKNGHKCYSYWSDGEYAYDDVVAWYEPLPLPEPPKDIGQ